MGAHATYGELVECVAGVEPDVICVQDVNGWGGDDQRVARQFAVDSGFAHFASGDSNSPFNLAIFSREPIIASTTHTEGFGHCARHAVVYDRPTWPTRAEARREVARWIEVVYNRRRWLSSTSEKLGCDSLMNSILPSQDPNRPLDTTPRPPETHNRRGAH